MHRSRGHTRRIAAGCVAEGLLDVRPAIAACHIRMRIRWVTDRQELEFERANRAPIAYSFPPKWGINERIPAA
jgi:hypothetical protein